MTAAHPARGPTAQPDPRTVRAEERRVMLREIAELGMEMARAITRRAVSALQAAENETKTMAEADTETRSAAAAPASPAGRPAPRETPEIAPRAAPRFEPRHDPAESFARVTRAVRLALSDEAKVEEELCDLNEGRRPGALKAKGRDRPAANDNAWEDDAPAPAPYVEPPLDYASAHRNRIRDCIYWVMNHEIHDIYPAQAFCDSLYIRLREGQRYDDLIFRPLKESVAAICDDLGLRPDWSLWAGEGWTSDPDRQPRHQWEVLWGPSDHPEREDRFSWNEDFRPKYEGDLGASP